MNSKFKIQNPKFSLPRYPRYKDSGVEWVENIPTHWDVKPGRVTLSLNKEKNAGNITPTLNSNPPASNGSEKFQSTGR